MKGQKYFLIAWGLLLPYLSFSQSSDEELITSQSMAFSAAMVNQDYEAMLALYTEDAKIFPNNTQILEGEALRSYWLPKAGSDRKTTDHKATSSEIKVMGDEAYDWGYYEGVSVEDGQESRWKGKYIIIWKRVDGEWKMYLDIWNRVR